MVQQAGSFTFSVVIPVYNGEATIARAIASVLAQSYMAHQVIVVDDASTDATCSVIKTQFPDVLLIENKMNGGSSVARNAGMDVATGDYIAFLDADDIWHHDKLRIANTVLSQNDITLLYNRYTQRDITKDILPVGTTPNKLSFARLLPGNMIATSCIIVRNTPTLRFQPDMRYTEDFDFCLRVCYSHNIYELPLPLTQIFRGFTTKGGISGNKWQMRKGEMRAYARLVKLNPLFVIVVPVLWALSLLKHAFKMLAMA